MKDQHGCQSGFGKLLKVIIFLIVAAGLFALFRLGFKEDLYVSTITTTAILMSGMLISVRCERDMVRNQENH